MKITNILSSAAAAALLLAAGQALADPSNVDEPTGTKILDLNGDPISGSWATETVDFVAGDVLTDIGFAFRDDPAYIYFDNASVTTGGGPNLLTNGDFSLGLTGWTYQNPNSATYSGYVNGDGQWYDGSVQAYDTLDQTIATVVGQTYTVSFDYYENSGQDIFRRLSTNGDVTGIGGNGINIVTYAGASSPVLQSGAPEPQVWAMMLTGLFGVGAVIRRRRSSVALSAA